MNPKIMLVDFVDIFNSFKIFFTLQIIEMQSIHSLNGGMVEWSNTSDCKSDGVSLRRFKSYSLHHLLFFKISKTLSGGLHIKNFF